MQMCVCVSRSWLSAASGRLYSKAQNQEAARTCDMSSCQGGELPAEVVAERRAMEDWAKKARYQGCPNPAFGDEWCPPWTVSRNVLADRELRDGYNQLLEHSGVVDWNPIRLMDLEPPPRPTSNDAQEDDSMSGRAGHQSDVIDSNSGGDDQSRVMDSQSSDGRSDMSTAPSSAAATRKQGRRRGVRRFQVIKKVTIVKHIIVPKNVKVVFRPCKCQEAAS